MKFVNSCPRFIEKIQERAYYDFIRDEFNRAHRPDHFLYLLARCVKVSVRYNANGEFNQSPDNRRKGRRPTSMRQEIVAVSNLLQGKTIVTSGDYRDILGIVSESDLLYMDPPYQGTSQHKDPRYYRGLALDELADFLMQLNAQNISYLGMVHSRQIDLYTFWATQRVAPTILSPVGATRWVALYGGNCKDDFPDFEPCPYLLSYDGRTGQKTYGTELPINLNLHKLEIYAGRSSQSRLLGGNSKTYESLYLSPALTRRLQSDVASRFTPVQPEYYNLHLEQMELAFA